MSDTQSNRETPMASREIPTLRLLFSGTRGIVDQGPVPLRHEPLILGRDETGNSEFDLRQDVGTSSKHAVISVVETNGWSAVHLTDQGSKNGTFVNGRRVYECLLEDGQVIRLGNSFFIFRMEDPGLDGGLEGSLRGRSPSMRAVRSELRRVASSPAVIMLYGETGTGKELAAEMLHALRAGQGRIGPYQPINCAAIPEGLAESMLFGRVAGAYSDARTAQDGLFRAAEGGTLFLDEVGEMPLQVQAKLLRAIEGRKVTPLGSNKEIPCDVRIVVATHRDLRQATYNGSFRSDLYMRLNGLPIVLPPLRARREDILPILAGYWDGAGALPPMTPNLIARILTYEWPGNVRELVQFATDLFQHAKAGTRLDLPLMQNRLVAPPPTCPGADLRVIETRAKEETSMPTIVGRYRLAPHGERPSKEALTLLLEQHRGNLSAIGREVGRDPSRVRQWLKAYGLKRR